MEPRRLVLILIAVALFGAIGLFLWYEARCKESPRDSKPIAVAKIRVISGHEFDITLADGKRIRGMLEVVTPVGPGSNAPKKVADLLNVATNPKVVLIKKEKMGRVEAVVWRVELYLTVEGREIKLSQWLKDNHLLWEE